MQFPNIMKNNQAGYEAVLQLYNPVLIDNVNIT